MPVQLAVVAGGDDVLYDQLQQTQWHIPARLYNFVHNMPTLMHSADLILCKAGGLIITESLACGLPMLLVDVNPGAETGNANYVVQAGTGEFGQDPIAVLEILSHWLEHGGQLLAERAANARALGRPRAAYTVADYAWTAAQHGPYRKAGQRFLGRSRLLDLLRRNKVPVKEDS
jgi:1,2-diacylglycerol 3-beta-galactosyltransferase